PHSRPRPRTLYLISHHTSPPPDLHSFPTRRSSDLSAAISLERTPRRSWCSASARTSRSRIATSRTSAIGTARSSRRLRASKPTRSEEHTSELQSPCNLVCRLLLEKKNKKHTNIEFS